MTSPSDRSDRGKPHWADFCYRTGGETVYVCRRHPNGVTANEHQSILTANPGAKAWGWQAMRRNADVYVRGHVRHADHAAIELHGWHRVLMNTEAKPGQCGTLPSWIDSRSIDVIVGWVSRSLGPCVAVTFQPTFNRQLSFHH